MAQSIQGANPLKGEIGVRLEEGEKVLRFNHNAFRLLSSRLQLKGLQACAQYIMDNDIEGICQLAYCSYLNQCIVDKASQRLEYDEFCAQLFAFNENALELLFQAFASSIQLGNPPAPSQAGHPQAESRTGESTTEAQ